MPGITLHLFSRFHLSNPLCVHRYLGPVPHDTSYYSKCMLGGALACGVTHAGITPLDVAKCNMQVTQPTWFPECLHLSQHPPSIGEPRKIQRSRFQP